jgi:hypothetical protein
MDFLFATRKATVNLQSWWRMKMGMKAFSKTLKGISAFQTVRRKYLLSRSVQRQMVENKSIVNIQTEVRRLHGRSYFLKLYLATLQVQCRIRKKNRRKKNQSIVLIQSGFRMYISRHKMKKEHSSAALIQKWWRLLHEIKIRRHLQASHIQTVARAWLVKRKFEMTRMAIVRLQRCWVLKFEKKAGNAIHAQSICRMLSLRKSWTRKKASVVVLQHWWRATVKLKKRISNAVVVQSAIRRWLTNRKCMQEAVAAKSIQKWWGEVQRGWKTKSIIIIQSVFRMYNSQKMTELRNKSSQRIQGWWRTISSNVLTKKQRCALRIQCVVRMRISRTRFVQKRWASYHLQQAWKVLLRQRVLSILLIQTMYRRHHTQDAFLKQRRSSIRIQSFVRKWSKKGAFASQRESILCLQKWAKRNIARAEGRKHEAMSKVIAYVQACARRVLHTQHYHKVICSAIKIQVAFDMMIQRKRKSAKLKNIITVQSLVRRCQARTRYSRQVMCSAIKKKMQVAFDRKAQEQRKKNENLPNFANVIINMQSMVRRGQARTRFAKRMQMVIFLQVTFFSFHIESKTNLFVTHHSSLLDSPFGGVA